MAYKRNYIEMYDGQMNLSQTLEALGDFEVLQIYQGDILLRKKH